jgi:transposase
MGKTFREWQIDQAWLLPPSVKELVPEGDSAHLVRDLVREQLDLTEILDTYDVERGYPPYHPAMMTALLLYGYTQGLRSSRKIARACEVRVDFMAITARQQPDFRTISDFRLRHLEALAALFGQVLRICEKAGMVKLGHVALDGTKIQANASKHKAMSYERMKKTEKELTAEIAAWFAKAEAEDRDEDHRYGRDKRGDELPEWLSNKQKRLEVIRAAKAELEAEAKAQLASGVKPEPEPPDKPPGGGARKTRPQRSRRESPKANGEPNDKAQLNFTDGDSRLLKTSDGFVQGYNAQAAVDHAAQIIVAHEVTNQQGDAPRLIGMLLRIRQNLGRNPNELSADAGYLSEANLAELQRRRISGYIATGRTAHAARERIRRHVSDDLLLKMRTKLARAGPRSRYRLRKQVVEPVFGQMKEGRGFRRMLLRGLKKVPYEWAMMCTAHNLSKLARRLA